MLNLIILGAIKYLDKMQIYTPNNRKYQNKRDPHSLSNSNTVSMVNHLDGLITCEPVAYVTLLSGP